jgi:hypothetical protein
MRYRRNNVFSLRINAVCLAAAFTLAIGGCDKKPSDPPSPGGPSVPAPKSEAVAVTPATTESAASSSGPSDGAAAIGGLSGGQGAGGSAAGTAPAATGGDGAASAPAK